MVNDNAQLYSMDVSATADQAWKALTDPEVVRRWYFGTAPRTSWEVGSTIDYVDDDGGTQITGILLEVDAPRTFSHTFIATWYGTENDQGSLQWQLEPAAEGTRIILVHRDRHAGSREGSETDEGSQRLMDSLRKVLEDG
ncbi:MULTISPECIES: SRPBCC domain-containing protein [unclassified Arthrobacter]|uniref:SRPBCC domain-containing protein n=1 Tax=unclassified Arthrobacter TaxID=235627 RepID=UPI001E2D5537|nr:MULTISPECIES: SRPBCC domain-containing protein [unclassified Arthrobacter]MCC9144099.1 SRPBCC domain-containing protein [Arthrobacter sp. zg-Y919]MDK1275324.1 SRPBCC domain-containing protein [Arthrobacter sp. zg.Y919]WIB03284.1 SRPBCC domain-containing protein [Arthrobacter sp. zg-Y919]